MYKEILSYSPKQNFTHIRQSGSKSKNEFEKALNGFEYTASPYGYFVPKKTLDALEKAKNSFTVQGLASMIVCRLCTADDVPKTDCFDRSHNNKSNGKVEILDVCAAPGGKSVYMAELRPDAKITACDIHPHRVELIRKYVKKFNLTNVLARTQDGTVFNPEFERKFDIVLCDVPCSGTGTIDSKPDVMLNRKPSDIEALNNIQLKILNNSAKYVRDGGGLVYSTCSVLRAENDGIIERFLAENAGWESVDIETLSVPSLVWKHGRQLLPHLSGTDGFFIAVLKRKA
jgi:16S rRNA (cytosine967-C5)-methyltransferase